MEGEIDSVDVPIKQEGLVGVEGETLDDESTEIESRAVQKLFGDCAGDDFVAFGRGVGGDVLEDGEDLFEVGLYVLGLGVNHDTGHSEESQSADVLVEVGVLLFETSNN